MLTTDLHDPVYSKNNGYISIATKFGCLDEDELLLSSILCKSIMITNIFHTPLH